MNMQLAYGTTNDLCGHELDALEGRAGRRLHGRVRHFRLMVMAGGLVLRGQASTYYAKQLAQHAIMEATTTPILANEIEVISASCHLQHA
jgi:hypothetical protein